MMSVRRALREEKEERRQKCSRRRTRESWWSLFMCVMMRVFATASWAVGSAISLGFLCLDSELSDVATPVDLCGRFNDHPDSANALVRLFWTNTKIHRIT